MKLFFNHTPIIAESANIPPKMPLDEIDELSNSLKVNLNQEVKIPKDVLNSFQIKDNLNQDIWIKNTLNPKVAVKLIKIAQDFFKDLNLPSDVSIKDIIFTGSLANFNWSKYSDIDLHIVLDFNQFDAEPKLIDDYFYAQKSLWNQEHDIQVFNFPVELYVQDAHAKLVATAVYSVLKNKWVKKPNHEVFELDKKAIKDKAEHIIYKLRDIRQDYKDKQYQSVVNKSQKLKDKIKQMRNAGLERGGEYSLENLVFKVLRRTTFMDQLDSFKAKAYDSLMSVSEIMTENMIMRKPNLNDLGLLFDEDEVFFGGFDAIKEFTIRVLGINLVKELGRGGNGVAYLTDKGTKLKYTFNKNEYEFAEENIGKKSDVMSDYYNADVVTDGVYVIEMEYLQKIPGDLLKKIGQTFHDMRFKKETRFKDIEQSIRNIVAKLGKHGNDLHIDNFGIKNGKLATFDPIAEEELAEDMSPKMHLHKTKKDLETKLGRRLLDSEWNAYLETGIQPKTKATISLDPQRAAEIQHRQAQIQAKIAMIKTNKYR